MWVHGATTVVTEMERTANFCCLIAGIIRSGVAMLSTQNPLSPAFLELAGDLEAKAAELQGSGSVRPSVLRLVP